jgi:glutamate/tyrosine decarboxylase-like PLP-dependent enzyme
MYHQLAHDRQNLEALLKNTAQLATSFLSELDQRPPAKLYQHQVANQLPAEGLGAQAVLDHFATHYAPHMTASTGPRYWGFVTGGTTPAALLGDWLVSAYDLNLADKVNSAAPNLEEEAIDLLRQLFGLPNTFSGVFVSGATLSNLVGLATGREWVFNQRQQASAAQIGLYGQVGIPVFSAEPHSSAVKSLAILGMGRNSIHKLQRLPGNREAMDTADLRRQLTALNGQPCIVLASGGTVNTVDFDDLQAIAALKTEFPFWLHVDAAFGGFAACSPRYQHLLAGIEAADSITVDAHKWLNVPYDSAMIFCRHSKLQIDVFQNSAAYLGDLGDDPDYLHRTPENSRRFRALAAWFTLMAYGKAGYQEIVERNCDLAADLAKRIEASGEFRLLAPARLNVICFTVADAASSKGQINTFLDALRDDGQLFLTPTNYGGTPGMRAALVNWRTQPDDLDRAWAALLRVAKQQA